MDATVPVKYLRSVEYSNNLRESQASARICHRASSLETVPKKTAEAEGELRVRAPGLWWFAPDISKRPEGFDCTIGESFVGFPFGR